MKYIFLCIITILWSIYVLFAMAAHAGANKRNARKLAVLTVLGLLPSLLFSYHLAQQPVKAYENIETEVDLMNMKFETVKSYDIFDWTNNVLYTIPNPLPDEFPFTITKTNSNNEMSDLTINSYDDLPITLDDVWYAYGTQDGSYYALTSGNVLSKPHGNMQQQAFYFADENGTLTNIYVVNMEVDDPAYLLAEDLGFVTVLMCATDACIGIVFTMCMMVPTMVKANRLKKGKSKREVK